jgi:DNA-binding NarL/FixJ family response regulator
MPTIATTLDRSRKPVNAPGQEMRNGRLAVHTRTEIPASIAVTRANTLASTRPTRILVADDHEVVRCGLRAILESHAGWKMVAEAWDGKAAVARAVEIKPDVAIIDNSLPLLGGIEVARQIRVRSPNTEVLVFAMHDSEALAHDFLKAGARAYLLKSDPNHSLIAAVEALADHKAFFTSSLSEKLLANFVSANGRAYESPLSPRERTIVQLIAEGHSNKQMSDILNLSIKTVEAHRGAAMRKLNTTSTAGLVRYAIRNSIVEA